jgi:undecaprenyl-diphosphatase
MFDKLIVFDKELLLAVNNWNSAFFDDFFYIFSGRLTWLLTALAITYVIFHTQKCNGWFVVLGLVLLILLSDQISSHLIKPLAGRFRPTHEPTLQELVHIIHNNRGGGFSFPSSHATNGFAFAVFTSFLFKNRIYVAVIFLWAILTAYSRMYLAMHYPLDIFGGIIIGIAVGTGVYYILRRVCPICCEHKITCRNSWFIAIIFLLTLIVIAFWHKKLVFLG